MVCLEMQVSLYYILLTSCDLLHHSPNKWLWVDGKRGESIFQNYISDPRSARCILEAVRKSSHLSLTHIHSAVSHSAHTQGKPSKAAHTVLTLLMSGLLTSDVGPAKLADRSVNECFCNGDR